MACRWEPAVRFVFAVLTALSLAACTSKPAEAADKDKGQLNYTLTVSEQVKVKAGADGKVAIVIKPGGGAHVDPRAPMAFEVKSGSAVKLAKTTFAYEDGSVRDDKSLELAVPFTGATAGKDEIKVHADFYLCTAKLC